MPNCELLYLHTADYKPEFESGLNILDPRLGIELPLPISDRSERDQSYPISWRKVFRELSFHELSKLWKLNIAYLRRPRFCSPVQRISEKADLSKPEICYPLKVLLCDKCWMVQTKDYTTPDSLFTRNMHIFQALRPVGSLMRKIFPKIVRELNLGRDSHVLEVGSNDGYLLRILIKQASHALESSPPTVLQMLPSKVSRFFVHFSPNRLGKGFPMKENCSI